jgi:predicted AlkP superfamily phosphohydrolase/phosphomutase
MTFPPSPVEGAMVAGYGAPPGARFTEPQGLQQLLASQWALEDLLDRAPHGSLESFLDDLIRGLRVQGEALPWAAAEVGADCVVAVWPHVDRAQHFFWRFRGSDHPLSAAVEKVYEAMDGATASLREAWPDADFVIVSDHGAGTLNGDVNLGAWLASHGYAKPGRSSRSGLAKVAWALPPSVRRFGRRLMPGLARKTMAATLSGQLGPFDWSQTRAFVGFHGDLWLNLAGREQRGNVGDLEAKDLRQELTAELLALRDPRNEAALFSAVHPREKIYSGEATNLAPDLMLDSWSSGYRVAPNRDPQGDLVTEPLHLAGVHESWSSDHRPLGIWAAAGPRIARTDSDELSLMDVCATSLALLEREVPSDLDGSVAESVLSPSFLERHPVRFGVGVGAKEAGGDYSDEEATAVAAHLRDLGYID